MAVAVAFGDRRGRRRDHGARQQARQQHDAGGQTRRRARDAAGQFRKQGHALVFSAIVAFGEEDERMRPPPYPLIKQEERNGGKEWVSKCRSWWWAYEITNKTNQI